MLFYRMCSFLCPAYPASAITALNGFCAIAANQAQSSSGITFFRGSGLRDNGRSHVCGPTVPQRHPKRSKHHWKSAKNPERLQTLQKCMKIKDFMKSDVDFRYSVFILSKALTQRARVPTGMPQLRLLQKLAPIGVG